MLTYVYAHKASAMRLLPRGGCPPKGRHRTVEGSLSEYVRLTQASAFPVPKIMSLPSAQLHRPIDFEFASARRIGDIHRVVK
jgi:hypothetical protein